LRQNIAEFFSNLNAPIATKRDKEDWQKILEALQQLKSLSAMSTQKMK
jgi:hypothetical protein